MTKFEWDEQKNLVNIKKHGVSFYKAQYAFADANRIILQDMTHSHQEERYYCIGKVGEGIITVRFTFRENFIRIFRAGYCCKGKKNYEKENNIY